jgi:hypothetical protein
LRREVHRCHRQGISKTLKKLLNVICGDPLCVLLHTILAELLDTTPHRFPLRTFDDGRSSDVAVPTLTWMDRALNTPNHRVCNAISKHCGKTAFSNLANAESMTSSPGMAEQPQHATLSHPHEG